MKLSGGKQRADDAAPGIVQTRWRRWSWLLLGWLALGLFSAGTPFMQLPRMRRAAPPFSQQSAAWRLFVSQWLIWLLWMALVPAALWLRRRFPIEREALRRVLPAHLLALAALCLLHAAAALWLTKLLLEGGDAEPANVLLLRLVYSWLRDLPFCVLFYGMVLGVASALEYYRQFRERELRASQLEAQLAQAQLKMLKMQLHPHFLFNTLNGITGLVRDNDNAAAVQMLVGLSELLRQTLESAGKQEVRLSEELEWLELYLKLQQMRFSDRLRVNIEAAPETLDVLVPNLITQPLVENAIRHGLANRAAPGSVSLTAQRLGERLELRVCDDGVGLPANWQRETSQGLGLANTAARLRQHFGTDFELSIQNRVPDGVEARLSLPWRTTRQTS